MQLFLHKLSCTSSTLKMFIPYLLDLGTYWYVNFQKQAHGLQGVLVIKRFFKILNWLVYILPQNQAAGLVVLIVRLLNCSCMSQWAGFGTSKIFIVPTV